MVRFLTERRQMSHRASAMYARFVAHSAEEWEEKQGQDCTTGGAR
jgi:hypothetical protein